MNEKGVFLLEVVIILLVVTVMTGTFVSIGITASEKMREKKEEMQLLSVGYEGAQLCMKSVRCTGSVEKDGWSYFWTVNGCSVVIEREDGRRKVVQCSENVE